MDDDIKTILLVSLSCVGDAVMTTPVLQALNDLYPQASIDIISDSRSSVIYTHCPYRGETILKDKSRFMRGALDLVSKVRKKRYDLIVDLRTDGLAYLFRGKTRLTKFTSKPYGEHSVENLMGVINSLHLNRDIPDTRIWITEQEDVFARRLLEPLPGNRWLVVVPDNLDNRKIWPEEKYIHLINDLRNGIDGVIFEGSGQEKDCAERIAAQINMPAVVLAGKTNLLQAAAAIKRATVFVGSDSGLGHIAGAVSTPSILLFSVDKPERVLPWRAKAEYLVSDDGYASSIPVKAVISRLDNMLSTY